MGCGAVAWFHHAPPPLSSCFFIFFCRRFRSSHRHRHAQAAACVDVSCVEEVSRSSLTEGGAAKDIVVRGLA